MSDKSPHVSIGMPVYNGEKYVAYAIESLLQQAFEDFELIISDNASTDRTENICRHFAQRDRRIRYYRNRKNLGAAANYNRVFRLSTARYFKWAPHDDICAPTYLKRCVDVLDRTPHRVVLCYPRTLLIQKDGTPLREHHDNLDIRFEQPSERLRHLLWNSGLCHAVVGLIRTDALRTTRLIGHYPGADNTLLAELVLQGEFWEIPEPLFRRRVHETSSLHANPSSEKVAEWFDPKNRQRVALPTTQRLVEHLRAVHQSSLSQQDKIKCYAVLWQARFQRRWDGCSLQREIFRAARKTTWDRYSLEAVRHSTGTYLPHRIWAFLSGLKHLDHNRLALALSPLSPMTKEALLSFVANCLSERSDFRAQQLLSEWLHTPCEEYQRAASKALAGQRTQ